MSDPDSNQGSSNQNDEHKNDQDSGNNQNDNPDIVITNATVDETIRSDPVTVVNQQGTNAAGSEVTHSTMVTDPSHQNIQVNEDLVGTVAVYDDDSVASLPNKAIVDEIKNYASQIQCSDFHGKGTIEDYSVLFQAAANIANESKQMQLDIDVDGFNEFGQAADDLSSLFSSFIVKLQNVNIINDSNFLMSIRDSLRKIVNLSNVFGRFKETILATSTLKLPSSAHDTKLVMQDVMQELDCAMNYINYFVAPTPEMANNSNAQLSASDKNVINTAVQTINHWNTLCEEGVSIALSSNPDLQFMRQSNAELKNKTSILRNATALLRSKFPSPQ